MFFTLPFAVVALSLSLMVLVPALSAVQSLIDSAYYHVLLQVWRAQDKLQIMWFSYKTHKDTQMVNQTIGQARFTQPEQDFFDNIVQLRSEQVIYSPPPRKQRHVRVPLHRSSRSHRSQPARLLYQPQQC